MDYKVIEERKKTMVNMIMRRLNKVYLLESIVSGKVREALRKKLSYDELSYLWSMILTSIEKGKEDEFNKPGKDTETKRSARKTV